MTTERRREIEKDLWTVGGARPTQPPVPADYQFVIFRACCRIADLEAKLADLARHTAIVEADLLRLLPSEPAGGAS